MEDIPDQLERAEGNVLSLTERAANDQEAINTAESVANYTALKADSLDVDLQRVNDVLQQLEISINNVTLVPESRYVSFKRSVDSIEVIITQMEQHIEVVADELSMLQEQSEVLERKYAELRHHRDLLNRIKSSIQNLDCVDNIV